MTSRSTNIIISHQPVATYSFIGAFFLAGSCFESKPGVAHLSEHLLLPEVAEYFDLEAEVGKEVLSLSSVQLPADTARAWEALLSSLNQPFKDERRQKELPILSLELKEYELDTSYQKLMRALFGRHPYARPAGGEAGLLADIEAVDVQAFMKDYLRPEMGVWVVCGNFDQTKIENLIKEHKIEREVILPKVEPVALQSKIHYIVESEEEGDQVTVAVPLVPNGAMAERVRLMVVRTALIGYDFSYLNQLLRDKERLVYSTETETHFYRGVGYLTMTMFTGKGEGEKVASMLGSALDDVEAGLDDETILKAKKRVILELTQVKKRPETVGFWWGEDLILSGKTLDLDEVIEDIENLGPETVREVAKQFFNLNLQKVE